jgi:hypothetical protein
MRRSICVTEPQFAEAGEKNTWTFNFTPAQNLPKGTKLLFDLGSKGRDIDWETPTTNLKAKENVIYLVIDNKKVIPAKAVESKDSVVPNFEFILPQQISAGNTLVIYVGAPKPVGNQVHTNGTSAQLVSQRRRPFFLHIDPTGKGKYGEAEQFQMDVKGAELKVIKIITPSYVSRNKRFDIVLRFEDEHGNLTNNAPDDTLIELSYENLRENLNWKLFIPETGFLAVPNLYFNEPGTYTIKLKNLRTKEEFLSSPIRCFPENVKSLFWGTLHGESERYDSTENIESCMRHFRDEKAYNFYGVSPFESQEETPNDIWKSISQNIVDFNEEDRFATFLGFQWQGDAKTEGNRVLVFSKENKPIIRKKDAKANLKKIYKGFSPKEMIAIPTFTMAKGLEYDFKDYDPDFERVVEIYNSWGSSETTEKEGNPMPIDTEGKKGVTESSEGALIKALDRNCRFGFVGGGLDDRGFYNDFFEGGQVQYPPGLTAIIANEYNRSSLFDALYNRSCYATTGERIILGFNIAGALMGQELSTQEKHGLNVIRHISGFAAGKKPLAKIEIIRNGKVLKSFEPNKKDFDFEYDDMESLQKVVIPSKDKRPPFVYYYLRVTQEDGHMAWSSPIWVDYVPSKAVSKHTGKKPVKIIPKVIEAPVEEVEDDFDDFDEDDE